MVWRRSGARVAGAFLLLIAGCSRGGEAPAPDPNAPPAAAASGEAVALTVEPAQAAPGQTVTLTARTRGGARLLPPGSDVKALVPQICVDDCKRGRWDSLSLAPVGSDGTTFTGQYTLPRFFPGPDGTVQFLPAGNHQLSLFCLYGSEKGCMEQPQAEVKVQVTATDPSLAWAALPRSAATAAPLPALGGFSTTAVDPTDRRHRVTCQAGSPNRIEMPDIPRLEVTRDGGATIERISLVKSPFAGQHNIMGCKTIALDPRFPDSFYGEDMGNTGSKGGGMMPPPFYSADHGQSWHPVPAPPGFPAEIGQAFQGFAMSAGGVTAWFSQAAFDKPVDVGAQLAGMVTQDGGRSWTQVPLTCEQQAPCARQVSTWFLFGYTGLLRTADGGQTWDWARYAGAPIRALSFTDLSAGRFLAVGVAVRKEYVPLLYSPDAGATWQPVVVPAPPDGWVAKPAAPTWDFPDLRVQPDGSLLAHRWSGQPENNTYYRLAPGAARWEEAQPPL